MSFETALIPCLRPSEHFHSTRPKFISIFYLKNPLAFKYYEIKYTLQEAIEGSRLELLDAILITIKAAGDCIPGRTAIQKLVYFESVFRLVNVKYKPHYYGPYSSEVSSTIQELTYLDFVKEEVETRKTTGFAVSDDWKRYCYTISRDGNEITEHIKKEHSDEYNKIINLVKICKKTANLDVNVLSWAAKVNYILSEQGKPMTPEEITLVAESFGWKLSQPQINNAVELLKQLKLCQAE